MLVNLVMKKECVRCKVDKFSPSEQLLPLGFRYTVHAINVKSKTVFCNNNCYVSMYSGFEPMEKI